MDEREQLFVDAEYCIDKYFDEHLMSRLEFNRHSRESMRVGELATGFGVRNTFLPGEDYANNVAMSYPSNDIIKLGSDLARDKVFQNDLKVLSDAWKKVAVAKVGEERYNELSSRLGCDLSEAYVNHRLSMRMVDYEVDHYKMQDTTDYLAYQARQDSLFMSRLSNPRDALQLYIEKRTVEKYNPSGMERGMGKVLGYATDFVVTLPTSGATSWGGLARLVGGEVILDVEDDRLSSDGTEVYQDVSKLVSKALFGEDRDVLSGFRQRSAEVNPYSSDVVRGANDLLGKKIMRQQPTNMFTKKEYMPKPVLQPLGAIPDYAGQLQQDIDTHFAIEEQFGGQSSRQGDASCQTASQETSQGAASRQDYSGWGSVLDGLGLGGFGEVGKNLGYVLAMLPDILIGMFTGKTKYLNVSDNIFPIAAIFGGMFVKNPLLKILLIGFGGANLLNKAGHEALERADGRSPQPVRKYRDYADKPLSPRLRDPQVKGSDLWVTIDGDPNVVRIRSEAALDAYEKGLLPLNTLANAVLARYDEQQRAVQEAYARGEEEHQAATRQRGIQ